MNQHLIKVGHVYMIVDRAKPVHVRIDNISQRIVLGSKGSPRNKFKGTILGSGKQIEFSSARVRYEVGEEPPA